VKDGDLIISPTDLRKYKGEKSIKRMPKSLVIKIKENKTGANVEFLDVRQRIVLTKDDFILAIKKGKYPGYAVKNISLVSFLTLLEISSVLIIWVDQ
jgi:hypothetical protein